MKPSMRLSIIPVLIFLLLAGGVKGRVLPTASAGLPYTAPMSLNSGGVFSIAGTSFVSADWENSYQYASWGGVRLTGVSGTSPWPFMSASVELPHGATLNSLTLYYEDNDPSASIELYLRRNDGAGGYDDLAATASFNDGVSSKTTTSILNPVVNNAYNYTLTAGIGSANLVLYGAKITYTPSGIAALGPANTASLSLTEKRPAGPPDSLAITPAPADPVLAGVEAAKVPALHAGGEITLLAVPRPDPDRTREETGASTGGPDAAPPATTSLDALGGGGSLGWRYHTIAGSNFHPVSSSTGHGWTSGGGRYITSGSTPSLVAPLDLIHGKMIQRVRFTYYDTSVQNPTLYLYQVDRQGNGSLLWQYNTPDASGGYLAASSAHLGQIVDNQNYAYYFVVWLGSAPAGSDLRATEIEIAYVLETYLPLILKN